MKYKAHGIPPDRSRQFDYIKAAIRDTLLWAEKEAVPLVRIEPIVPFVETDFSLFVWLFFDTEAHVDQLRRDGTAQNAGLHFCAELQRAGYPTAWQSLVSYDFSSKELVDRQYMGNYFYFLR